MPVNCQGILWQDTNASLVVCSDNRQRRTVAKDEAHFAADYCSGGQRHGCIRRNVVPTIRPCDGSRRRCDLMACPRENTVRGEAIDDVTGFRLVRVVIGESSGFDRRDRIGYRQCRAESIRNRDCATIVLRGGGRKCQDTSRKRECRIVRSIEIKGISRNAAGNRIGKRETHGLADLHRAEIRLRRKRIGSRDRQRISGVKHQRRRRGVRDLVRERVGVCNCNLAGDRRVVKPHTSRKRRSRLDREYIRQRTPAYGIRKIPILRLVHVCR